MFKKEEEVTNSMCMRIELSKEGKKRKSNNVKMDERIDRTVKKYEDTGNIKSFLKPISFIQICTRSMPNLFSPLCVCVCTVKNVTDKKLND